jgi:alpha/beta hydrolase
MRIETHHIGQAKVAEIQAEGLVLTSVEDGLSLLGDLYYQGFDKIILHEENIVPEFFNLKTKLAGEVLQKFVQYRMPLAVVGDFSECTSKSLRDFIYECNQGRQVNFVQELSSALKDL